MKETGSLYLAIKLYHSENHLGYNAMIKVLQGPESLKDPCGILYISFDHRFPKFLWEKNKLTPGQREYLELRAQVEVEKNIAALTKRVWDQE
jgi:hypothetical protein